MTSYNIIAGDGPAKDKLITIALPAEHLQALIEILEIGVAEARLYLPDLYPSSDYIAGMAEALKMELPQ